MKAVLLMAGKGTRMAKDYSGPKHLLEVAGKPLIEHVLGALPPEIEELIFIVGGPHEQTIRDYFAAGDQAGRPITFVVQEEQLGLAHAFKMAKDLVGDKWLGMVSDDVFDPEALQELVKEDLAVLSSKSEHPENFGVLVADDEGYLVRSVEKPQEFVSDQIWNGAMVMSKRFMELDIPPSSRGEYETPDVWMKMIEEGAKIKIVLSRFWLPINDKAQLEEAEKILST